MKILEKRICDCCGKIVKKENSPFWFSPICDSDDIFCSNCLKEMKINFAETPAQYSEALNFHFEKKEESDNYYDNLQKQREKIAFNKARFEKMKQIILAPVYAQIENYFGNENEK